MVEAPFLCGLTVAASIWRENSYRAGLSETFGWQLGLLNFWGVLLWGKWNALRDLRDL